jgi:hypothetical protein
MKPSKKTRYRRKNPWRRSPTIAAMTPVERDEYFRAFMEGRAEAPNDPKLIDWRRLARWLRKQPAVTAVASSLQRMVRRFRFKKTRGNA